MPSNYNQLDSSWFPHYYRMCPWWPNVQDEKVTRKKSKEFCEEQFVVQSSQMLCIPCPSPKYSELMFTSMGKKKMEVLATTRGVSHFGLAMYIKLDFKAKE